MKTLFLISFLWIFYTYVGYLSILILATLFRKRPINKKYISPKVSMILAAYNEEKAIEGKIKNCLALDYPKEKLEIIVGSDCSTDKTDEIVLRYAKKGVKLVRNNVRKGKTAVQNLVVKEANGEILIFSDATTIYAPDSLKKLVRNFNDPEIGCVTGEERFFKPGGTLVGEEVSLFWKYERFLRKKESEFNTLIVVTGCIFAIRQILYEPVKESLVEDFDLPLKVISNGYRVVQEEEALGYEETVKTDREEFTRKVRIVIKGMDVLLNRILLLNPFKYRSIAFQIISHKIFRWLTPFFLILLFFTNIFLMNNHLIFLVLGYLQIVFYVAAATGYFIMKKGKKIPRFFRISYYFTLINLAALVGVIKFISGERKKTWAPVR